MRNFMLVSTFMALGISTYFPPWIENALALLFILTIGVVHGANDLILIKKSKAFKTANSLKNLSYYIGVILLIIALFFIIPQIALPVFVLFSAYHFGEQHWETNLDGHWFLNRLFYIIYGLFIFSLLFAAHTGDVQQIIYQMSDIFLPASFFNNALLILLISVLIFLGVYKFKRKLKTFWLEELFFIVVFFVVFNTATLLWAFAVYFVLWHSIPSIKEQVEFLYGTCNKTTVVNYLKLAWIYWLVALMGFGVVVYFFKEDQSLLLAIFFSFLAAITFPHVLIISKMHGKTH